ncbi:hypothetical protein H310_11584 [Aphanomyces invadans]|uniref:Roadblock/LAMTOR2 domain-containing protein n=1 Tax=Aphanomyces invadans TaxID=157072 RepID=A0A024TLQ0_9STRA|nr:hypothetical protein H310_11584 [Aphanomyces invadans]ETV94938.1 hypothetical protein H310_11584 [Aphanomyces invadans]|eukprot:XP_008876529.1 hypothetical protein H310_11584 [Aphanomyces invadans]
MNLTRGSMEEKLHALLDRYEDLAAILVSTSEGVPLLKVEHEENPSDKDDGSTFEYAETVLPSVFAAAAEQAGKLKFGSVSAITCFFDSTALLHINHMPLVITLIAAQGASLGALFDLADDLKEWLTPLKKVVETTEAN